MIVQWRDRLDVDGDGWSASRWQPERSGHREARTLLLGDCYRPRPGVEGHCRDDEDCHPDFVDKAAVLLVRPARNHPLLDGNKRAAWVTPRPFIEMNGWPWGRYADVDESEHAVLAVASSGSPRRTTRFGSGRGRGSSGHAPSAVQKAVRCQKVQRCIRRSGYEQGRSQRCLMIDANARSSWDRVRSVDVRVTT